MIDLWEGLGYTPEQVSEARRHAGQWEDDQRERMEAEALAEAERWDEETNK